MAWLSPERTWGKLQENRECGTKLYTHFFSQQVCVCVCVYRGPASTVFGASIIEDTASCGGTTTLLASSSSISFSCVNCSRADARTWVLCWLFSSLSSSLQCFSILLPLSPLPFLYFLRLFRSAVDVCCVFGFRESLIYAESNPDELCAGVGE